MPFLEKLLMGAAGVLWSVNPFLPWACIPSLIRWVSVAGPRWARCENDRDAGLQLLFPGAPRRPGQAGLTRETVLASEASAVCPRLDRALHTGGAQ